MTEVTELSNYQNKNIKQKALEKCITHDQNKDSNNIKTNNI